MKAIQIAIDGPSGAGKSTLAKKVAERLRIAYLDTGAMYRAVALKALRKQLELGDAEAVGAMAQATEISVGFNPQDNSQSVFLDGEDVSGLIRTPEVALGASKVAAHPAVRSRMVALQQALAAKQSVVMDGRDIGTHVLPQAEIKIFLTASVEERARRRYEELEEKGLLNKTFEELKKEIEDRDYNDTNRAVSPLRQAPDAILLDTSGFSLDKAMERLLRIIEERLNKDAV